MNVKCTPKGPKAELHKRHLAAFDKINEVIDEAAQVTAFAADADDARESLRKLKAVLQGETEPVVT